MNWQKIVGVIMLCMLLAGSICGVVYGVQYYNLKNTDSEQKYEQLLTKYNSLQTSYNNMVLKYDDVNSQLYALKLENDANKVRVAELETAKAELETQAEADAQTIADLQSQVDSLNSTITANEETIASLEAEKLTLQNRVAYLEELLSAYEDSEKLILSLYVDDEIYDVVLVEENGTPDFTFVETPTKKGYNFLYWSLDGETEVDVTTLTMTEDTSLYAVFEINVLFEGDKLYGLYGVVGNVDIDLTKAFPSVDFTGVEEVLVRLDVSIGYNGGDKICSTDGAGLRPGYTFSTTVATFSIDGLTIHITPFDTATSYDYEIEFTYMKEYAK